MSLKYALRFTSGSGFRDSLFAKQRKSSNKNRSIPHAKKGQVNFMFSLFGFLLFSGILCAQNKSDFSFTDQKGNQMVVEDLKSLPSFMDSAFLKNELYPYLFKNHKMKENSVPEWASVEIFKIRKWHCYKIMVCYGPLIKRPKVEDLPELLGHQGGGTQGRMKIKRHLKRRYSISSFEWTGVFI